MNAETPRGALAARLAEALAPREEILEAYLFGSRARGRARADSDIDVAVYVDADKARALAARWGYRAALATDLMTALQTNDVDVVVLNEAPPLLYHRALRGGIRVLSRDLAATTARAGRALSRWFDFAPYSARMDGVRRRAAGGQAVSEQ